jgi:hypothetical protein
MHFVIREVWAIRGFFFGLRLLGSPSLHSVAGEARQSVTRYLLKKSRVRCQASLAAASS